MDPPGFGFRLYQSPRGGVNFKPGSRRDAARWSAAGSQLLLEVLGWSQMLGATWQDVLVKDAPKRQNVRLSSQKRRQHKAQSDENIISAVMSRVSYRGAVQNRRAPGLLFSKDPQVMQDSEVKNRDHQCLGLNSRWGLLCRVPFFAMCDCRWGLHQSCVWWSAYSGQSI